VQIGARELEWLSIYDSLAQTPELAGAMLYSKIVTTIGSRFRRKRLARFRSLFPPESCPTILDVGGTSDIWDRLDYPSAITLVNTDAGELHSSNGYQAMVADGRCLPFPDGSFALAFSNSVIEHVGDWKDMQAFAAELRRVGRSYYCQTPNKWFPVEPHLGTVFLHWFPRLLNHYFFMRYLTLWGLMNKPDRAQVQRSLAEIRLLTRREVYALFPEGSFSVERFLGLAKSFIVFHRAAESPNSKPPILAIRSGHIISNSK
jgi:Methyltransferase domain